MGDSMYTTESGTTYYTALDMLELIDHKSISEEVSGGTPSFDE